MSEWYLYLVRCYNGSLYTGITVDVDRRFAEHQTDKGKGAKYLRGRGPLTLVFQQKIGNRSSALAVEGRVKKLSKARKEDLIRTDRAIETIIEDVSERV
jgi:putative endonuclease